MSPHGHDMSIGLWIISGVLEIRVWAWAHGYGLRNGLGNGSLLNMSRAALHGVWSLFLGLCYAALRFTKP
jgi:hypothetical protein